MIFRHRAQGSVLTSVRSLGFNSEVRAAEGEAGAEGADKFSRNVCGDMGGFDSSEDPSVFSWQAVGLVGYDLNKRMGGYRVVGIKTENGSGNNEHGLNLRFNGAMPGLQIRM
jgi:hypothetical protein